MKRRTEDDSMPVKGSRVCRHAASKQSPFYIFCKGCQFAISRRLEGDFWLEGFLALHDLVAFSARCSTNEASEGNEGLNFALLQSPTRRL